MFEIDKMKPDEVPEVAQIYEDGWKVAYRGIMPDDYLAGVRAEQWIPLLTEFPDASLVLRVDGRPVATATIGPARDESRAGWGEIMSIYVRPEYVGKGYGKTLLRHAVTVLRGRGFDRIYVWTLEKNRNARAFYEREGFSYNGDLIEIELGGAKLIEFRYERDFRAEGETRGQSSDLNRE